MFPILVSFTQAEIQTARHALLVVMEKSEEAGECNHAAHALFDTLTDAFLKAQCGNYSDRLAHR